MTTNEKKGRRIGEDVKEQVIALYETGLTPWKIGKRLDISASSVDRIIVRWKEQLQRAADKKAAGEPLTVQEETTLAVEERRREKKIEFVNSAWTIIGEGMKIIEDKLIRCQLGQEKIKAKDIAVIVGTMYDKQALALGESTDNVAVKKFEDL